MKLGTLKLAVAGFAGAAMFVLPAMSAPISAFPKGLAGAVSADDGQIVLVRNGRGAARGGAVRGGAVRGGAVYRGGAVVRRGVAVGGPAAYYGSGYCDPNYQNCGGGAYYGGVYGGGAVARGGAVVRGGAAVRGRGAHVAHRGGGGMRRR